jgi:hypothetical protein
MRVGPVVLRESVRQDGVLLFVAALTEGAEVAAVPLESGFGAASASCLSNTGSSLLVAALNADDTSPGA